MNDISKKHSDGVDIGPASIRDLLDAPVILPGESEVDYATLSSALRADLAPQTVFEELIVADIIKLEWERWLWRRMIGVRVTYKMRQLLSGLFHKQEFVPADVLTSGDNAVRANIINAIVGNNSGKRTRWTQEAALGRLQEEFNLSHDDLIAEALSLAADEIDTFEQRLQSSETRRRKLYDDLLTYRADRAAPIENVEFEPNFE